jgi:(p)ppGpp synthase/HD superfamily hydrolase
MNDIEKAISIAVQAHSGQKDKAGMPYVLHPLRLMLRQDSTEAMIGAVLHDVVEDTDITIDQLAEAGFSSAVLEAISLLTHDKSIPYMDYIRAIARNAIARQVKLADLIDNMDLNRIPNPQEKDYLRLEKYKVAYEYLTKDKWKE